MGGISAGISGGSVGDIFAGIGKGMFVGAMVGIGGILAFGGIYYGKTSPLGVSISAYGANITANYLEVAFTQGKKSYFDGDDFWQSTNDVINAMYANTKKILLGRIGTNDSFLYGTRIISKIPMVGNIISSIYEYSQLYSWPRAIKEGIGTIFEPTVGIGGIVTSFLGVAYSVYRMGKAIFTTPDFENTGWILF